MSNTLKVLVETKTGLPKPGHTENTWETIAACRNAQVAVVFRAACIEQGRFSPFAIRINTMGNHYVKAG